MSSVTTSEYGGALGALASEHDFHEKYRLGVKVGLGHFAQVRVLTDSDPDGGVRAANGKQAVKIVDLTDKEKPGSPKLRSKALKVAIEEVTFWTAIGDHPNCVNLHNVFVGDGFCYMVMEMCRSSLLAALESLPKLTERELGRFFSQMLLALAHCHSIRIVHRDVKPDNFLVGGEDGNTVKLCDFGMSAWIPGFPAQQRHSCGTAPYMCPEMLAGNGFNEKADVWSFAVVVYVLLFGQFPYMAHQRKTMKLAVLKGSPAPSFEPVQVRGTRPMHSLSAFTFAKTLLTRDPEERPSAEDALKMSWMHSSMQGDFMSDQQLPCLRSMLRSAKKVGAFEGRDLQECSNADLRLDALQMQAHDQRLPEVALLALEQAAQNREDSNVYEFKTSGSTTTCSTRDSRPLHRSCTQASLVSGSRAGHSRTVSNSDAGTDAISELEQATFSPPARKDWTLFGLEQPLSSHVADAPWRREEKQQVLPLGRFQL
jgi:serine/threonine protein kinase